jgi:hypothetical protein
MAALSTISPTALAPALADLAAVGQWVVVDADRRQITPRLKPNAQRREPYNMLADKVTC